MISKLDGVPYEKLLEWANKLNSYKWPDDLPFGKPENWDELYNSDKNKHLSFTIVFEWLCSVTSYYDRLKYLHCIKGISDYDVDTKSVVTENARKKNLICGGTKLLK